MSATGNTSRGEHTIPMARIAEVRSQGGAQLDGWRATVWQGAQRVALSVTCHGVLDRASEDAATLCLLVRRGWVFTGEGTESGPSWSEMHNAR